MQTPKDEYTSCDHPTAHTNNIQAKPRRESFAALIPPKEADNEWLVLPSVWLLQWLQHVWVIQWLAVQYWFSLYCAGLITYFCPCVAVGNVAEAVGENKTLCCIGSLAALYFLPIAHLGIRIYLRNKLRSQKGIEVLLCTIASSQRDINPRSTGKHHQGLPVCLFLPTLQFGTGSQGK